MVAKIKFWLLQRSMSITKAFVASYGIEIYVTVFFINNQAMFYQGRDEERE